MTNNDATPTMNEQSLPAHRRPFNPNFKPCTIYWRHNSRQVVWGESVEKAFSAAGYSGGAVAAIDFYVDELDCSYYRDDETKQWVKLEELAFDSNESIESIRQRLTQSKFMNATYTRSNGNTVTISQGYARYIPGWVKRIEVMTASRYEGAYHEEDPAEQHYMGDGVLYFNPDDWGNAINAFIATIGTEAPLVEAKKTTEFEGAVSINQLLESQAEKLP